MPVVASDLPHAIREIENTWIVLSDGCRLAARIWLPVDAEASPVPAILEYLPYRKRDQTTERDAATHPYVAGHGYACVRVDLRGTGDSDGILRDEYLKQKQDDGVEVIAWIAAQAWCAGKVGMIGISWGGFNALQVAARQPPALAAIVSVCSTDDRYADDVHFMGGALLGNNLTWGSTMLSHLTRPPDPAVVGDRWRDMWLRRLENLEPFAAIWMAHPRRDAQWTQGSVCEDFAAIACPVYAVGGWSDAYSNAVPRLLAGLKAPCKGLIGPWAHGYPQSALPGPQIGFLRECLRWWDHWLKGHPTGIMEEPRLRAWVRDNMRPAARAETHPGRWVAEAAWPRAAHPIVFHLTSSGLAAAPTDAAEMLLASPEDCGLGAGAWCPYGGPPDLPLDQRDDDARSLVFDSAPLREELAILGAPILELAVSADAPVAKIVARLCEVHPDGASTRVTYGVLNLTHRDSHAHPQALTPGETVHIRLALNDIGHAFAPGNRIRVALSTTYWPLTWPTPARTALRVSVGDASLSLPVRLPSPLDATLAPFAPAEAAQPLQHTRLGPDRIERVATHDHASGERAFLTHDESGRVRIDATGLEFATSRRHEFRIHPADPLSARAETLWHTETGRGDWQTRTTTKVTLTATGQAFRLQAEMMAFDGETSVTSRVWDEEIARDLT